MKTILMTGAAGDVGAILRKEFQGRYRLRLSDIAALDDCASNEEFVPADLSDLEATRKAVAGVDGIIHLGGFSVEGDWDRILNANIIGTRNLFEAARIEGVKRIVFASSNHAMGFYRRDETVDHTDYPRPDSRYGVSKVFGEAMGSLYSDKYGAEVMNIRIGNVAEEPADVRRLAIWISPRDLAQLVSIGLEYHDIRFEVVYGMSEISGPGGTTPTQGAWVTTPRTGARTTPPKCSRSIPPTPATRWQTRYRAVHSFPPSPVVIQRSRTWPRPGAPYPFPTPASRLP